MMSFGFARRLLELLFEAADSGNVLHTHVAILAGFLTGDKP